MRDNSYIIGMDIGGTFFRIGAVNKDNDIKFFRKISVGKVFHTSNVMEDLTGYLKDYLQVLEEDEIFPKAMAIGFPAALDRDRKTVLQAPNISFMENVPVVDELNRTFGIPVYMDRDVCMKLYYDKEKYNLPDCEVLAGIYFGTGIGNAINIFGKSLRGRNGTAGELGHIPVDGNDQPCGCGNLGCMENLAGGKYLAALCRDVFPETRIEHIFSEHGKEPQLQKFVDRMAITVATELNILNPDFLIIGGGVPNMEDFPKELLMDRIQTHARKPYPAEDLQIIFTDDSDDKCVIGAANFVRYGV